MYTLKNFSYGELAADVSVVDTQITLTASHTLPTIGTFVIVVWDIDTFPNPADDPNTEIMEAAYSGTGNVYDVVRAKEDTIAVEHSSGDQVALHMTAGVLEAERLTLNSATGLTLSNGILSITSGYGIPTTAKQSNWDTAYGWGNHAGLYDLAGTADTEIGDHELAYNHTLLHNPATVGGLPLTLDGQEVTFNYDTDHFQLDGNNLQLKSSAVQHGSLSGLQGGTTNEYYHLTATEHGYVSGANAQSVLTTASPTFASLAIGGDPGTLLTVHSEGETANTTIDFECEKYLICNYTVARDTAATTQFITRRSRGTLDTPTTVAHTDEIGTFAFQAHDGTAYRNVAGISALVDGAVDTEQVPGSLYFYTNPGADISAPGQ